MLEESLQRDIRRALHAADVAPGTAFVLVELGETGLRASVVDATTGASLVEHGNGRLCPHMLDLTLADHLVRMGRVTRPESTKWAAELIELMPQVRERLAAVDGAFAMGSERVAMFRMSRNDCVTALSTELADAASIISRTVGEAGVDVGAVVAMPDHESWPGLLGELAERLSLPVVALDGEDDDGVEGGRHTDAAVPVDLGDHHDPEPAAPAAAADQQAVDEQVVDEPDAALDTVEAPRQAATATAGDASVPDAAPVFVGAPDVTQPISVVRTAEHPDHGVEQGGARNPGTPRARDTGLAATGDHDVVRGEQSAEEPMTGAGPRTYAPPAGRSGRAVDNGGRRRLAVGAVAVGGAVALGGVILAVPWLHGSDTSRPAASVVGFTSPTAAPQASTAPPSPTGAAPTTTAPTTDARAPIDTRPAQVPAVQYTAPPAPQQQAPSYVSPARPRRGLPLPVIPRRRTIPNPIPGLPPIVLP
ncbi:hypothetical protein [uncultured Williamsia sp.]|uniref:hypothetical protein n=1 Tax=uncultured Williamsia sp. TaxID=259311 RepID=UPI002607185C|nr:hypothetical protein [uncultured Williamsia sp.]